MLMYNHSILTLGRTDAGIAISDPAFDEFEHRWLINNIPLAHDFPPVGAFLRWDNRFGLQIHFSSTCMTKRAIEAWVKKVKTSDEWRKYRSEMLKDWIDRCNALIENEPKFRGVSQAAEWSHRKPFISYYASKKIYEI
jgi:hypothetical protein